MPLFRYRGVDNTGRSVSGLMTAHDEPNLEEKLRAAGSWLLEAEPEKPQASAESKAAAAPRLKWLNWWGKAKRRDLIEFCTLMAFQTKAGIPLLQGLEVCSQDCEHPSFRRVLVGLQRHLESGLLFYQALEQYPRTFSSQFLSMVKAGELSSKLPETFEDLRDYMEWLEQIVADIRQASLYPTIVFSVVAGFVLFLFTYIIPKFVILLESTHVALPMITQVIFGVSDFAKKTWWAWAFILLFLTVGTSILKKASKTFAVWFDGMKLKLPIFGELNMMLSISRFTHNLAILYRAGLPIMQAMKLCQGLVGNAVVEKAVAEVEESIGAGETISEAIRRQTVFPSILLRMVVTGETTGNLDAALDNVSDYYNQIIPRRIKKLFSVLEPAMMLFLIFLVGAVALSIFLPILSLMGAVK
jgi:type IV pilus assembly protein PilC